MEGIISLASYFDRASMSGLAGTDAPKTDLRAIIGAIAAASIDIAEIVARGKLAAPDMVVTTANADGDVQTALDVQAHQIIVEALRRNGVRELISEESEQVLILDEGAPYCVAIDPLDGSSNIDTNMSIGTIFSVAFAAPAGAARAGSTLLAAGFVVYGPQTTLVLTLGAGVDIFTLDRRDRTYRLSAERVRVPDVATEYAINAANYRHWHPAVRAFVDDCLSGTDGPGERNFNMRWIGSLVAEAYRILIRGGVFLYPADARHGYENGRLRLLYEAHPIAFVMEQAGGMASTGHQRILDRSTSALHERTPLIFGSRDNVERIERLHARPDSLSDVSPLFGKRGLFRL